eukprot:m.121303 g.121303  ORF g.121303 m.121303 type:complete len:166 (-) comp9602_c0_seq4:2328-2825(-)
MNQHLIPPLNFGFVETDLYRSGQPNELNIPFLETLRLKTIIFLSPDEPAPALSNFSQDHGIKFEHVGRQAIFGSSRLLSEEAVLAALQHILQLENYPILICCNLGRHNTGTVVGCLRKLQRWNLTSIFEEYRRFAGSKVNTLSEQFIEFFDTDMVTLPSKTPAWL